MQKQATPVNLESEFSDAQLGDPRRVARLLRVVNTIGSNPSASLPGAFADPSQLSGTYRFLNNPEVAAEEILAPHIAQTVQRTRGEATIVVAHDTTSYCFDGGARDGLGVVDPGSISGFYAHTSLCMTENGEPLGVVGLYAWVRTAVCYKKRPQQVSMYDPDRESVRWNEAVHHASELIETDSTHVIHVMDREADAMELFADMVAHERRFVVRLMHDRRLEPGRIKTDNRLFQSLEESSVRVTREVSFVRRSISSERKRKGKQQARSLRVSETQKRTALLELRASKREIFPGNGAHAHIPDSLALHFVEVCEIDPPEGVESVHWKLATTERIDTPDDVVRIVDLYRRRWLIEEYFKAIKTGCQFEKAQLETGDALMRLLAIYSVVAWQMLCLRWMERNAPDTPASRVLNPRQLAILRAYQESKRKPLSDTPTASEVLRVIALMGGHQPQNGPPGWLIIRRGLTALSQFEMAWELIERIPKDL